jgi:hypothetical protein
MYVGTYMQVTYFHTYDSSFFDWNVARRFFGRQTQTWKTASHPIQSFLRLVSNFCFSRQPLFPTEKYLFSTYNEQI